MTENALPPIGELVADRGKASDDHFEIAGLRLGVRSADPTLRLALTRALQHLSCEQEEVDLSIEVATGEAPALPTLVSEMTSHSATEPTLVKSAGRVARLDPVNGILNVLDRAEGRGLFWVRDPASLPHWEEHSPFRHILAWWLAERKLRLVHAAGIGSPSGGALIVGPSGRGKSTVALTCIEAGFSSLGDDLMLVDPSGEARAFALYPCVKLQQDNSWRFPSWERWSEPVDDKTRFFLAEARPEALIDSFPISCVVVPRIGDGTTTTHEISAGEALRELAASTMFQFYRGEGEPLNDLAEVVQRARCFGLHLGPDLSQIAGCFEEMLGTKVDA